LQYADGPSVGSVTTFELADDLKLPVSMSWAGVVRVKPDPLATRPPTNPKLEFANGAVMSSTARLEACNGVVLSVFKGTLRGKLSTCGAPLTTTRPWHLEGSVPDHLEVSGDIVWGDGLLTLGSDESNGGQLVLDGGVSVTAWSDDAVDPDAPPSPPLPQVKGHGVLTLQRCTLDTSFDIQVDTQGPSATAVTTVVLSRSAIWTVKNLQGTRKCREVGA
jgi:hypothetical protein